MAFRATHIFWSKFGYLVTVFYFLTKKYVFESKKCIMFGSDFQSDTYLLV